MRLSQAVSPAEDGTAPRPWAPSLTQSPWLANGSPVCEASVFQPPFWHCLVVSLLPPLAAAADPAATPDHRDCQRTDDHEALETTHQTLSSTQSRAIATCRRDPSSLLPV